MANDTKPKSSDPWSFAGDVSRLGDDQRLQCPKAIRDMIPWLVDGRAHTAYAELVAEGWIRVWKRDSVSTRLETLRMELQEDSEAEVKLAVFTDRYREITKQTDGRLRLPEAVLLFLGITPGERPYLYVQGNDRADAVTIMNLARRRALLEQYKADTSV